MPFTEDDMTTIRSFAGGLVEFAEEFRILWAAQLAAKTREVDQALEGLGAQSEAFADAGQPNLSRK